MGKLGIYARQSVEKETTGSIDDQIKEGKDVAIKLNLPFEVYVDRGATAAKDTLDNRPDFMRLIEDIQKGIITSMFVIDQSRLSRNQTTQLYIKKILAAHQVKVHTKLDGIIDFEDSDSELMSDIRALFASKLVKDTSKKIKGVLLNNALSGKAGGGATMPWGFKKDENKNLIQDEEEVKVYLRMVEMSLRGIGSNTIAEILNKEGVKTKGAKHYKKGITIKNKFTGKETKIGIDELDWAPNTVLSILKNSIYCGRRKFKGQVIAIEPIISPDVWEKIQENLKKNKTFSGGIKKHFYLLKGILRCERCGRNLYGYVKEKVGKEQRVYMCSSKREKKFCGMRSINIDRLDRLVWKAIRGSNFLLDKVIDQFNKKGNNIKIKSLNSELKNLISSLELIEKKKDGIIDLYSQGRISIQKFDDKNKELLGEESTLLDRKDDIERQIKFYDKYQDLEVTSKKIESLFERLSNLSKEEKADVIRMVLNEVQVNYNEVRKVHLIKILINLGSTIIQEELPIRNTEKPDVDFDLLIPAPSDFPEDDDGTRIIRIGDDWIDFHEVDGKLIPSLICNKNSDTINNPHVVTQTNPKSCGGGS